METQANNLDLRVVVVKEAESAVRESVKERATNMVRSVLEELGAKDMWKLIITGLGSLPAHQSQYWMTPPEPSTAMSTMVQITIHSSLIVDGVVSSMLLLPREVDRDTFLKRVIPIIERFNSVHWHGIVEREERESMKPSGQVVVDGRSSIPRSGRAGGTTIPGTWSGQSAAESNRIAAALAVQRSSGSVRVGRGRIQPGPPTLPATKAAAAPVLAGTPSAQPELGREKVHGQWMVRTMFVPRPVGQRGSVTNTQPNTPSERQGDAWNPALQGNSGKLPVFPITEARLAAMEAVRKERDNGRQERIQFLLAVLKRAPSGVFFWRDTKEDQQLITGNRIGLSQTLLGLGWIVSTGQAGQYRVTEEFRRTHDPAFKFEEQVELQSPDEAANGETPPHGGQCTIRAAPVAVFSSIHLVSPVAKAQSGAPRGVITESPSNVTELLSQRQAIDNELRQRLEERRAELASLRERLTQLEQEVTVIEAALSPAL